MPTSPTASQALAPWPEQTYLVGHQHRFVFCPVPEVMCTTLGKGLLALTGLGDRHGHHDVDSCPVHGDVHACAVRELGLKTAGELSCLKDDSGYFRFAFVRNPWIRLLSAYLDNDKIGGPDMVRPFRQGSFREFVESTLLLTDPELDECCRPQASILGGHRFDFIGRFEDADLGLAVVNERLGTTLGGGQATGGRNTVGRARPQQFLDMGEGSFFDRHDPVELQVVRERLGGFPHHTRFYPTDLRQKVERRYAADVARFGYRFGG